MTMFASEQFRQRPLGLICIFSPSSIRCEAASGPSWASLQTLVWWIPKFGLGGSSPRALWGLVGVGQISCVTLSSVYATGGAKLTTLASMARVSCSMSLLTGVFKGNLVPLLVMGSAKPSAGIPLLLNPPSNRFPFNGESIGLARGLGRTSVF